MCSSVNDAIAAGFLAARARLGAVILDLLWKTFWLVLSLILLAAALIWFQIRLAAVQIQFPVAPLASPAALAELGRELWRTFGPTVIVTGVAWLGVSALLWVLLEAYFRAGLLPASCGSFFERAGNRFGSFLLCSLAKIFAGCSTLLILTAIVIARFWSAPVTQWSSLWPDTRAVFLAEMVLWLGVWFLLTFLETLVRADATDLIADRLFEVIGTMGVLIAVELCVDAGALGLILTMLLFVSGVNSLLRTMVVALMFLVLLTGIHAFLLQVRYSSLTAL